MLTYKVNNTETSKSDTTAGDKKTVSSETELPTQVNTIWHSLSTNIGGQAAAGSSEETLPIQTKPLHSIYIQRMCSECEEELEQGPAGIQTKLTVGAPDDEYEQEADAVADKVMRMPAEGSELEQPQDDVPVVQTKSRTKPFIQRLCAECEYELSEGSAPDVQTKSNNGATQCAVPPSVHNTINTPGGGAPLSESVRSRVEPVLGADLSGVRVYSGSSAQKASQSLDARAFTHQNNIFLGKGQSASDVQLMAHEATHVIQQKGMVQNKIQRFPEHACEDGEVINRAQSVVWFEYNSTRFRSDSEVDSNKHFLLLLREIRSYLALTHGAGIVLIHGYASEEGGESHNFTLSSQRALRIRGLLEVAGIPAANMIPIGRGESTSYRKLAYNRRVEATYFPSVTCTPCAFTCSARKLLGARTPHYGRGADFRFFDFPSLTTSQWLRVAPFRLMPDSWLEADMNKVLGVLAGSDGIAMVSHFRGGSGSTWTHGIGSRLNREATYCTSINNAVRSVRIQLAAQMRIMRALGTVNCSAFSLSPVPTFHFSFGDSVALKAIIGGTQGLEVYLDAMRLKDPAKCDYELDLQFIVFDDFGVDTSDLYFPALIGFWILQHERRGNRPFVNRLLVNRTITV